MNVQEKRPASTNVCNKNNCPMRRVFRFTDIARTVKYRRGCRRSSTIDRGQEQYRPDVDDETNARYIITRQRARTAPHAINRQICDQKYVVYISRLFERSGNSRCRHLPVAERGLHFSADVMDLRQPHGGRAFCKTSAQKKIE